jgi:multiple sugar transport system permease protein
MRRMRELTDFQFALILTLPILAFLLALVLYPLGYAMWLSFQKTTFLGGLKFHFIGLQNYSAALSSADFWNSVVVSLRFTMESLILTMAIGLGIALILNQSFPGKGIVRSLSILPWAISAYATGILFKYLLRGKSSILTALSYAFGFNVVIDLLDQHTVVESLALGNAWNMAPLVAFFLLANMQTIPSSLYDLAKIDKMSLFQQFRYVTLPHIRFTLFVFTNVVLVLSLKAFDYVYVQTGGGPGTASATMTYQIYKESYISLNLGYGSALSFYLLFIIIVLTLLLYVVWGRKEG